MKVYATINQEVVINPKEVIKNLIEKEIGRDNWIFKEGGKFYEGFEQYVGSHSVDSKDEITKEKYEYVKALQLVLSKL